ncbi:MAG: hypothetical protein Q8M16_21605 [Pirellulaceae bacterium]|nr:hypothetical protein [Pirellulaceae bacterium]
MLQGKNDLTICHGCGCELSYRPIEALKTVALFESQINFDSGLAKYPGELANAESTFGTLPDVELESERYLPSGYFDVSARDIELDERWHADQLLERISQLEQTFLIAESLIEPAVIEPNQIEPNQIEPNQIEPILIDDIALSALNEPIGGLPIPKNNSRTIASNPKSTRAPGSQPLIRFDAGHVATPEQIRAYNEQQSRQNSSFARDSRFSGADSRESSESSNAPNHSTNVRIDVGHQSELPMAKPILNDEINAGLHHRMDTSPKEYIGERSSWTNEARQFTCAALGTVWIIQLLIGLAVVSNGPLAIWSLWLVAETIGTICLGRIGWQLLIQRDGHRNVRNVPRPSNLGTTKRDKRTARSAQHDSNGI